MNKQEWKELLDTVQEVQENYENVAYVGGIAVYLHMAGNPSLHQYAAVSHDAELVILQADFIEMRDIEVITANRRLTKGMFNKNGFYFYIHIENQAELAVVPEEIIAFRQRVEGICLACPEHLLVLKLNELTNRKGSPKGDNDEDDIFRVLLSVSAWNKSALHRLTCDSISDLGKVVHSEASLRLAAGSAHEANRLRDLAGESFDGLKKAFSKINGPDDNDTIPQSP